LPVGVTQDGHPWIGAEHPILEITEFTDYQCFQCKKMHHYLRQIIMEHPDKIRLIHRHFPLDSKYNFAVKNPLHDGSADLALLAIYASTKGKFWEMNDLLYNHRTSEGPIKIKDFSDKLQFDFQELRVSLHSKQIENILRIDLWEGYKLGIRGTPAYVINGKVHRGSIPSEIINSAIGSSYEF
jgi:protein-disulfide isomerase